MKQSIIYRSVPLLLAIVLAPFSVGSEIADDQAAIRSQIAAYAAARQKGDGEAQARFYTEDADEWPSMAREMVRGRAGIAKALTLAPNPNRVVKFEPIQITFVKPDVALVDSLYGSPEPIGHAFYVMIKQDERWLIRSARITRFPQPTSDTKDSNKQVPR